MFARAIGFHLHRAALRGGGYGRMPVESGVDFPYPVAVLRWAGNWVTSLCADLQERNRRTQQDRAQQRAHGKKPLLPAPIPAPVLLAGVRRHLTINEFGSLAK